MKKMLKYGMMTVALLFAGQIACADTLLDLNLQNPQVTASSGVGIAYDASNSLLTATKSSGFLVTQGTSYDMDNSHSYTLSLKAYLNSDGTLDTSELTNDSLSIAITDEVPSPLVLFSSDQLTATGFSPTELDFVFKQGSTAALLPVGSLIGVQLFDINGGTPFNFGSDFTLSNEKIDAGAVPSPNALAGGVLLLSLMALRAKRRGLEA